MMKSQKTAVNKGEIAVFYSPIGNTAEVRSGYLWKSPPQKRLKTEKSWKKRYFVLFKISEQEHLLKYFKSPEEKDMPVGGIDLSQISVLNVSPEKHQRWNWVEKTLKCSPSCAIHIRAAVRDYFLVADNSDEVNGWFADLYAALKNRPHRRLSPKEMSFDPPTVEVISYPLSRKKKPGDALLEAGQKIRSKSDPPSNPLGIYSEEPKAEERSKRRASIPLNPIYDYPRAFRPKSGGENSSTRRKSYDAIYESISEIRNKARANQEAFDLQSESEHEYEEVNPSTLMKSVTKVFGKLKTQITGLPAFEEETAGEHRKERRPTSEFSSSSSDNGAVSPEETLPDQKVQTPEISAERCTDFQLENERERDFRVKLADLKKHLTETEVERKPRIERRLTPYFGRRSSSNGAIYALEIPEDQKEQTTPPRRSSIGRERNVLVKQEDLKKHLTLTEVNENLSVSGWTYQPQTVCLFHKGDQILAINDLLIDNLQEFNVYLSKSLKNEVKLTTLRLSGSRPLHSQDCPCSD
ncbi:pleckstrin homology domain-containing family S member 1-like isoform 2-T2 [Spinachia spinachia]